MNECLLATQYAWAWLLLTIFIMQCNSASLYSSSAKWQTRGFCSDTSVTKLRRIHIILLYNYSRLAHLGIHDIQYANKESCSREWILKNSCKNVNCSLLLKGRLSWEGSPRAWRLMSLYWASGAWCRLDIDSVGTWTMGQGSSFCSRGPFIMTRHDKTQWDMTRHGVHEETRRYTTRHPGGRRDTPPRPGPSQAVIDDNLTYRAPSDCTSREL